MAENPRRRFRFSLRTFFVVVAVLATACAWMAREASIVRERQDVLNSLYRFPHVLDQAIPREIEDEVIYIGLKDETVIWRRWLGARQRLTVLYYPCDVSITPTKEQLDRIKSAFPEATIEPWPDDPRRVEWSQ